MHIGNERDMNKCKVIMSDSKLELAHGFDERRGLDVTYGASELQCAKRGGQHEGRSGVSHLDIYTSTMHTSGCSPVSSTGTLETRSIQSWIAFVTWGTIYGVFHVGRKHFGTG